LNDRSIYSADIFPAVVADYSCEIHIKIIIFLYIANERLSIKNEFDTILVMFTGLAAENHINIGG
jgi:hypothetical protein